MPAVKIAPSLLAADFARLKDEIQRVEAGGADWLHLDVMDGHFVPNLTIGPPVVEAVRKVTKLPLDCHLMVLEPEKYLGIFADAGADGLTFHAEAVAMDYARKWKERGWAMTLPCKTLFDPRRVDACLDAIRTKGKRAAVAINPGTEAECVSELLSKVDMILAMTVWPGFGGQEFIESVVPKVAKLRKMAPAIDLEVDGGLNPETAKVAGAAGANVIVAGTATFRSDDVAGAIAALRRSAEAG
jgi:ribulose-phosphate 3-epimerase